MKFHVSENLHVNSAHMDEIRQPYRCINSLKRIDASYCEVNVQSEAVLLLLPCAESIKSMFQESCEHKKRVIIIFTVTERLKRLSLNLYCTAMPLETTQS